MESPLTPRRNIHTAPAVLNLATVADPLILSQYDMRLSTVDVFRKYPPPHYSPQLSKLARRSRYRHTCNILQIREWSPFNSESFTEYHSYISGITQKLDNVRLHQKISVSLKISSQVDVEDDEVLSFLSKFGSLVKELSFDSPNNEMSVFDFCHLLVRHFPNLQKLDPSGLRLTFSEGSIEHQFFKPDSPQHQHTHLKKMSFGPDNSGFHVLSMEIFLKIFPNLEEIENFPLDLINAVVVAQKGQALKSLSGFNTDRPNVLGETVLTAYEKLAGLKPKLTSMEFDEKSFPPELFPRIRPYLFSVLQSSCESLEWLVISRIRPDFVEHFPARLERLKELELKELNYDEGLFFPSEMSLGEKFPHVSNISFGKASVGYIRRIIPYPTSWGLQINHLGVGLLDAMSLPLLHRRFPNLQGLGFSCSPTQIPKILKDLPRFWPELKSLSILIDDECHEKKGMRPLSLDSAVTGLPEKVIHQLEDPSRKKDFTEKQVQGFKRRSIICKLKELKKLKLILGDFPDRTGSQSRSAYLRLTAVAHEFGFSLLPDLKVTVTVKGDARYSREIMKDLEELARCRNVEIED